MISQADLNLHSNYIGRTGGVNVLSVDSEANDVGYAGYIWNDETAQWHVRNRELSPKLGRWLQRDPANYISGWNLYEYVSGTPIDQSDWSGLVPEPQRMIPGDICPESVMEAGQCSCAEIAEDIKETRQDCKRRFNDLIDNPNDLPKYGPKNTRESHLPPYLECVKRLVKLVTEFLKAGCVDDGGWPPPPDPSLFPTPKTIDEFLKHIDEYDPLPIWNPRPVPGPAIVPPQGAPVFPPILIPIPLGIQNLPRGIGPVFFGPPGQMSPDFLFDPLGG